MSQSSQNSDFTTKHVPGPSSSASYSPAGVSASDDRRDGPDQVSSSAQRLASAVRNKLLEAIDNQKRAFSERLSNYGSALDAASSTLSERGESAASDVVATVADQTRSLTQDLDQVSVAHLPNDAAERTRSNPAIVLGGLFVAGFALSRFISAAEDDVNRSEKSDDPYRGDEYR